jgi:hypothetical protein
VVGELAEIFDDMPKSTKESHLAVTSPQTLKSIRIQLWLCVPDRTSTMSRHVSGLRSIHLENAVRIQSIGIRHASGHAPLYRPPTGYMFNERVINSIHPDLIDMIASEERQEAPERRLGTVHVGILWNNTIRGCWCCNKAKRIVLSHSQYLLICAGSNSGL